ncbi:MAG TPA: hypothetical protein VL463_05490 [Kofleriaceae bacterium]|nr:hypothetical protein [Kofleriaceae bacterium]
MKAIAIAALVVGGCAWLSSEASYDRKVRAFEREAPDREALARGDTASTERVLGWMSDWQTKIGDDHDVAPVPRQRLIDRLDAAARRFKLEAAKVAAPEIAFALARPLLTDDDRAALPVIRRATDGVAAERQQELARTGSYFHARAAAWVTTDERMWMYEGDVATYEKQELRDQPASCVFATAPFGPEGTRNEALVYRVTKRDAQIYARCYLHPEPNSLPVGRLSIDAPIIEGDHPHVDFVIDPEALPRDRAFGDLDVEIRYTYDGTVQTLSRSKLFWDRDGER